MQKEKIKITDNVVIGKLTVLWYVARVRHHELYHETRQSYLAQGSLYECICECGLRRLISRAILETGRIKSCGCLKIQIKAEGIERRLKKQGLKVKRAKNTMDIKYWQNVLFENQRYIPPSAHSRAQVDLAGFNLRRLFQEKAFLNRKHGAR